MEVRIRHGHRGGSVHADAALASESQNREGHVNPVVVVRLHDGSIYPRPRYGPADAVDD